MVAAVAVTVAVDCNGIVVAVEVGGIEALVVVAD